VLQAETQLANAQAELLGLDRQRAMLEHAIAVLVDQDYRTMSGSSGMDMISGAQSFISYSHSGFIAIQIAAYIRNLGYPARAHFPRVYQVAVTPILLYAGLGEISRTGMVLNPDMGLRFKAAVVTTDFPLIPDKPIDFGLQSFCERCKKCAAYCPSQAIASGPKTLYNGYETWRMDVAKCVQFRIGNKAGSSCGRCIKVCPWNRRDTWHHRLSIAGAARSKLAQRALIKLDEMLRSNLKPEPEDRWWRIEDFADVHTSQHVMRFERWHTGGHVDVEDLRERHWPQIRDRARAAGFTSVWLLYGPDEYHPQLGLVSVAARSDDTDESSPADLSWLEAQPSPAEELAEELGSTKVFDRTSWVYMVWFPITAEADPGDTALWPNSPPLPGLVAAHV